MSKINDTLAILSKLTKRNKAAAHLRGLRLKDNTITATDTITTLMLNQTLPDLDCLVPADTLIAALKSTKDPELFQSATTLHVREKNYTADIGLIPADLFDKAIKKPGELEADVVKSENMLEVADEILSFFKAETDQTIASVVFFVEGHAYMTDNRVMIRVPTNLKEDGVVAVSRTFLDILLALGKEQFDIRIGSRSVQAWFDGGILETSRINRKPPTNFPVFFNKRIENVPTSQMDEETLEGLKKVCKYGTKDKQIIEFDHRGIAVRDKSKAIIKIAKPMPPIRVKAQDLSMVLDSNHSSNPGFNMEADPTHFMIFRGDKAEGVIVVT